MTVAGDNRCCRKVHRQTYTSLPDSTGKSERAVFAVRRFYHGYGDFVLSQLAAAAAAAAALGFGGRSGSWHQIDIFPPCNNDTKEEEWGQHRSADRCEFYRILQ